ncbi:glycosyltransferase family protein [Aurantimonas sp. VKM B-3413]|uniref:glycosyltransferase family protein n=1 Tax=Aurantimonas sp. VKM B-3413 TaxID=2779401 RepID=UPI001E500789|nr:glycosyltransferase [Aurantimonas sp. VKM B-3413]MCB8836730.1 glycosyl transferase [Aurantimonas sp. VKM B-3413]
MRVLFHVQHLLGVGHLRRGELITNALADRGIEVTVALGGHPVAEIPFARANVVQLPQVSIRDADFKVLYDEAGEPVTEAWRAMRRDALLDLYRRTRPDVVLLEMYPFGRWRFGFELEPLLSLAAEDKPRVKCATSVRDILVATKHPERARKGLDIARRTLDRVLVHSDPTLFTFGETYPHAGEIAELIGYTGYVTEPAGGRSGAKTGDVIVSAGGGAAAGALFEAAIAARPLTALKDRTWRIFTGPRFPEADFRALKQQAGAGIVVERFAADFQERLDGCALSISQAGYNTVMNLLRAEAPAIVIPYDAAEETEQLFRARRLEELGLLTILAAGDLGPQTLSGAIAKTLERESGERRRIDLDGAEHTAAMIEAMIRGEAGG